MSTLGSCCMKNIVTIYCLFEPRQSHSNHSTTLFLTYKTMYCSKIRWQSSNPLLRLVLTMGSCRSLCVVHVPFDDY